MQLKVAKNSIFAALLRSPWWISLLVALIVGAVARYFLAGIFGSAAVSLAFPFLVISGIAAWRQLQTPSAARVEETVKTVSAMSWRDFQALMQRAFERQGYAVKPITGAADFLLQKDGRDTLVCCKRWKAAKHGVEPLRDLVAARDAREAHGATYVAVGELTANARDLSTSSRITLMQAPELARLLRK